MKPWELFAGLVGLGVVVGLVLLVAEPYGGVIVEQVATVKRRK